MISLNRHDIIKYLIILLVLSVVTGCQKKKSPLPDHLGGQIFQGKVRMDIKCHGCHGWVGEGSGHVPPLVKKGKTLPFKEFYSAVIFGRGGLMPAYNRMLSEKDIRLIMDWLEQVSHLEVPK